VKPFDSLAVETFKSKSRKNQLKNIKSKTVDLTLSFSPQETEKCKDLFQGGSSA
jgi:hypothetical protein